MKSNEELWREVRRVQARITKEMMKEEKQEVDDASRDDEEEN